MKSKDLQLNPPLTESDITPELIKSWAVDIAKKAFESDESMSSSGENGGNGNEINPN